MALRINKVFNQYGFSSDACYVKIDKYGGTKESITARFGYYYNESARRDGKEPLYTMSLKAPFNDGMTIADLYTYAKVVVADFAGAEDVIDSP